MSDLTGFSIIYDHEGMWLSTKNLNSSQPNKKQDPDVYTQLCAHYDHIGQHHRLDQTASGLFFSTNPILNPALSRAFKEHKIARSYWIWVIGTPSATGTWSQPLDGKKARSHYNVLSSDGMTAHLNVTLETGRTHQIRRHAIKMVTLFWATIDTVEPLSTCGLDCVSTHTHCNFSIPEQWKQSQFRLLYHLTYMV